MTRPPDSRPLDSRPIVITGMMGSGKTLIGSLLARAMGLAFVDSDQSIEKEMGMSVAKIFARHGEAEFRRREAAFLDRQIEGEAHVLALGGGAFLNRRLRDRMRPRVVSVWLKVPSRVLHARVRGKGGRPLLAAGGEHADIARLLAEREPVYALADITINGNDAPSRIVEAIRAALAGRGTSKGSPSSNHAQT